MYHLNNLNHLNWQNPSVKIAILGYGAWGLALAYRYARVENYNVIVWGRDAAKIAQHQSDFKNKNLPFYINFTNQIADISGADIIIIATPSHAFEMVSDMLLSILFLNTAKAPALLIACKGLVKNLNFENLNLKNTDFKNINVKNLSIQFLHKALEEKIQKFKNLQNLQNLQNIKNIKDFKKLPYVGVLTGPSFAKEFAQGLPCALTLSYDVNQFKNLQIKNLQVENINQNSETIAAFETIQKILHQSGVRIYLSDDPIGCQVGGAYKNVIALASGIAHGLGLGLNAQAALITRGLSEMTRLGVLLGAQAQTLSGLAGLGDLILTATGNLSRNRLMGELLAQNYSKDEALAKVGQVVESVYATELFHDIQQDLNNINNLNNINLDLPISLPISLPILENVYAVLFEGLSAQNALKNLLQRQARYE